MDVRDEAGQIQYTSRRTDGDAGPAELVARYCPVGLPANPLRGTLEYFLTERYCLYNVDDRFRAYRLEIHHLPWTIQYAEAEIELNTMAAAAGIRLPAIAPLLHFSRPSGHGGVGADNARVGVGPRLATQPNIMATTSRSSNTLAFKAPRRRKSLIEWNDPSKQAHILDWRHRAQDFGLTVETREDLEEGQPFVPDAEQILHAEEPEAFEDQAILIREEDEPEDYLEARPPVGREEVDLVRVYLQHIGKRKLLKAPEERAIGERIEKAQRDLVIALGDVPSAVQTLVALADRIRAKGDPAAELILLPKAARCATSTRSRC